MSEVLAEALLGEEFYIWLSRRVEGIVFEGTEI